MRKYRGIMEKHPIINVCAHDQLNDLLLNPLRYSPT